MGISFRSCAALFGAAVSAALCGCATYLDETHQMRAAWENGAYESAAKEAADISVQRQGSADELVWKLESGAASRGAGKFKDSEKTLDEAYVMTQKFDAEPEVSVADEGKALLTNLSYLPYRGYNYDRIMMGTYQALNCMQNGKPDDAAVMLKRIQFFQEDSSRKNAERIAKGLQAAKDVSGKKTEEGDTAYNYNAAMKDPAFQNQLKKAYGEVPQTANSAKADYLNPFAYWLDGIYFMYCGKDGSDFTRAVDSFRLARTMVSADIFAQDMAAAEKVSQGYPPPKMTYVIYEGGSAPKRTQIRIDIPLFIVTRDVPYVGAAFPKLEYNANWSPNIQIAAGGAPQKLETIADMDSIVRREFDDELPLVIAKTLLSAGTKAAAQYGLQEAVRGGGNDYAVLAVMIAGSVYQASMNDADLRTWTTLPKQIKVAQFPTPADLKMSVEGAQVSLYDAPANIVWVRKVGAQSKAAVAVFALGKISLPAISAQAKAVAPSTASCVSAAPAQSAGQVKNTESKPISENKDKK